MAKTKDPELITDRRDGEVAILPVQPPPASHLHAVLETALASGRSAQELHDLIGFIERMDRMTAEKAFNEAMAACQAEMPVVVREAENAFLKTKYAKLEHVNAAIKPCYTKHGFSLSFGAFPAKKEGHEGIWCDCQHKGGFTKRFEKEYPLDGAGKDGKSNKTPIQASGSTESYGRRYITYGIFNVTVADQDDDGAGYSPPINEEQIKAVRDTIAEIEADGVEFRYDKFLAAFEVDRLEDMRQSQVARAINELRRHHRQAKASRG